MKSLNDARRSILKIVIQFANWLDRRWSPVVNFPRPVGGKVLSFEPAGRNLGYPIYRVVSLKGGLIMGAIEWSNQWQRPRFKAYPEAIFDQQCVAEIYAKMRDFR